MVGCPGYFFRNITRRTNFQIHESIVEFQVNRTGRYYIKVEGNFIGATLFEPTGSAARLEQLEYQLARASVMNSFVVKTGLTC